MMHEKAASRLRAQFCELARCATRPGADRPYFLARVDVALDEYLSCANYATEWDADQWGFGDQWMAEERRELRKRAKGNLELVEAP